MTILRKRGGTGLKWDCNGGCKGVQRGEKGAAGWKRMKTGEKGDGQWTKRARRDARGTEGGVGSVRAPFFFVKSPRICGQRLLHYKTVGIRFCYFIKIACAVAVFSVSELKIQISQRCFK